MNKILVCALTVLLLLSCYLPAMATGESGQLDVGFAGNSSLTVGFGVSSYIRIGFAGNLTNIPSSHDFDIVYPNSVYFTGLDNFLLTNNSGFPVDVSISGTDMTGGIPWVLSDTAEPDVNVFGLKVGLSNSNGNFTYSKQIFLNTSSTGANITTSQSDFPICVHINTSSWSTQAERDAFFDTNILGKRVQFFDSDQITNLDYEVEYFSNVQGSEEAIYWIRVPSVAGNSTTDSVWVAYGNDPNGSDQDNPTGVWDTNYVLVDHMNDLTTSTTKGSTGSRNGTKSGVNTPIEASGLVGKGQYFDGTGNYIIRSYISTPTAFTAEVLFKRLGDSGGTIGNSSHDLMDSINGYNNHNRVMVNKDGTVTTCGIWSNSTYRAVPTMNINAADYNLIGLLYNGTTAYAIANGVIGTGVSCPGIVDAGTTGIYHGRITSSSSYFFGNGTMDEVRISNIARSADWIRLTNYSMKKTNFNGDNGVSAPFLSWGAENDSYSIVVKKTIPFNWLAQNILVGGNVAWGLELLTPTNDPFDDGVQKSGNITLSAEAS